MSVIYIYTYIQYSTYPQIGYPHIHWLIIIFPMKMATWIHLGGMPHFETPRYHIVGSLYHIKSLMVQTNKG